MKKRIYINICAVGLLSVLLTALLSVFVFYGFYTNRVKSDLKSEGIVLARSMELAAQQEHPRFLRELDISTPYTRITMIAPDGGVLYDSRGDIAMMENHKDRPEVQQAITEGTGYAVRLSETLNDNNYYFAIRMQNGQILRVAHQSRSIIGMFTGVLPLILLLCLVVFGICMWASKLLTARLIKPIELAGTSLNSTQTDGYYAELSPFFTHINSQNKQLSSKEEELERQMHTMRSIIDNMQEGLVLLDTQGHIVLHNKSAVTLLGARAQDYTGKNYRVLSRADTLYSCIAEALEGHGASKILEAEGTALRLLASPAEAEGKPTGALLLILDITQARKAEQIRRDFSANVSHELKTPLTAILGYGEMIETGMAKTQDVSGFAARICKEARRLLTLINDIIRLSEIETGPPAEKEPLQLRAICDEALQTLSFEADRRSVALNLAGSCQVLGQRQMLGELIYNLCDNALKYNVDGGQVNITLSEQDQNAIITVQDTGIGVDHAQQERIFERFYRVDKSRSKETGGTGLGLSIVRHVVEEHGGHLRLESSLGQGTTITVSLPKNLL